MISVDYKKEMEDLARNVYNKVKPKEILNTGFSLNKDDYEFKLNENLTITIGETIRKYKIMSKNESTYSNIIDYRVELIESEDKE